jgi:hypothetical protein
MTTKVRHGVPAHWIAALAVTLLLTGCNGLGWVAKPQANVKIGGATVPTAMGSYCWSSGGQSECVDMASIDSVIQAGGLSPIRVLANNPGAISFDRPPKSMDLKFGSDEAHLQAVPVVGMSFRAPSTPGRWEYVLSGQWDQGDVSWVFLVSVGGS